MSTQVHQPATGAGLEPAPVNIRIKISAAWAAMLFVFVYVDIFSLYRPDVRSNLDAGTIGGFEVGSTFLLGATVYVVVPSLMVFLTLVLGARVSRMSSLVLAPLYGLTIIAGAIGEWSYYVLGSAVEVALLAAIAGYAWTWPRSVDAQ